MQGYQVIHLCPNAQFPPGLYLPATKLPRDAQPRFIPLQTVHGLHFISSRNDVLNQETPNTRRNQLVVYSRKLGFCPLATLWETRQVVHGLETLADAHFPRHFISDPERRGRMTHVDFPTSTGHRASRCNEVWHMDTFGPTRTRSIQGYYHNTSFTCDHSGYVFSYGHSNMSQMPEITAQFFADTARIRERHGDARVLRCDNASVNVSAKMRQFLQSRNIRQETSNPYESHQNGTAERTNRTLETSARTALLGSGLSLHWWHHAIQYATFNHNVAYSRLTRSSPHVLMFGEKPDVSDCQQFGCEGWLHRRADQRPDSKFSARGEPVVFVGYSTNQKGFLVWCSERDSRTVVSTTNVVFGHRCPFSKRSNVEIFDDGSAELSLSNIPATLTVQDLQSASDLHVVGTFREHFVLADSKLTGLRLLSPSNLSRTLHYTHKHNYSAAHLSLLDSYSVYHAAFPDPVALQEVSQTVPKNLAQALSPDFADEWGAAIDRENAGFLKHDCFEVLPSLPPNASLLPGMWVFSRKRETNLAKARWCVCGNRQVPGRDCDQVYCGVLSSRDNKILLSLAASEHLSVYQTDVVQAVLHSPLTDVHLYTKPPARYPCPPGSVLKLLKSVYGLHQAPLHFKQEVCQWFRSQGYTPANDAETVWIKRVPATSTSQAKLIIHALYADDMLHFTNDTALYQDFVKQFKKRFDVKSGAVGVYLGNRVVVNHGSFTVTLDQTHYTEELLERFGMSDCTAVPTAMSQRLSTTMSGDLLPVSEHATYRNMVGSMLYLASWTRPDISYAVSELSRFVSAPGQNHMTAAKHLLRYLKGTKEMGLKYSRPSNKDQWIAQIRCGDMWTLTGQAVRTPGGLPRGLSLCSTARLFPGSRSVSPW